MSTTDTTPGREPDATPGITASAREILPVLLAADPYIPEAHDDEAEIPVPHRSALKGVIANALVEHGGAVDAPSRITAAVTAALAELGYGTLLAELDGVETDAVLTDLIGDGLCEAHWDFDAPVRDALVRDVVAVVGPIVAKLRAELERVNNERERLYAQVQTVIERNTQLLAERDEQAGA